MFRPPVRPLGDGGYALALDPDEQAMLRRLCADLRELVQRDDPAAARLFPPAYRDDEAAAAEFDRLVREGLVSGRLRALATVERTAAGERLTHEELEAWCGALNDMRLVLGEKLGVTEDMDESLYRTSPDHALYGWLTWLQAATVEALSSRL